MHNSCQLKNSALRHHSWKITRISARCPNPWAFWRMLYSNSASRSGNIICTARRLGSSTAERIWKPSNYAWKISKIVDFKTKCQFFTKIPDFCCNTCNWELHCNSLLAAKSAWKVRPKTRNLKPSITQRVQPDGTVDPLSPDKWGHEHEWKIQTWMYM